MDKQRIKRQSQPRTIKGVVPQGGLRLATRMGVSPQRQARIAKSELAQYVEVANANMRRQKR